MVLRYVFGLKIHIKIIKNVLKIIINTVHTENVEKMGVSIIFSGKIMFSAQ